MTAVPCPNGHLSEDPDWCDTCGARIGAPPTVPPAPQSPTEKIAPPTLVSTSAGNIECPHCGAANPADALFCEACGYDFTTGQAPPSRATPAPDAAAATTDSDDPAGWIVVVEVDQAWYALKGALAEHPCPPSSSSTVPLGGHTALIGRTSASRGLRPEVALDADTGVSRRHAQFVIDGDVLTVVDLSSTNGTYVVTEGIEPDEVSSPLVPGVPSELHDGDRVYVGAWTRLTVRAT